MAFSVINAGQRNTNVAPELIALSTLGGFRLTGPAAKALGIKPTDNVMFLYDEESKQYAIAKGYAIMKNDGTPKMCAARINKKAQIEANFDAALDAALSSNNAELVDALSVEGISHDEQVALLAEAMQTPEVQDYAGSKCASPSGFTGEGASVCFTDSNIWGQLKSDMEDKAAFNRGFAIDVNEVFDLEVYNGYENVVVKAVVLGETRDFEPSRRGE